MSEAGGILSVEKAVMFRGVEGLSASRTRSCRRPTSSCNGRTRSCRRPTSSCNGRTRSCRRPTSSCNGRTRSCRRPTSSCNGRTRFCRCPTSPTDGRTSFGGRRTNVRDLSTWLRPALDKLELPPTRSVALSFGPNRFGPAPQRSSCSSIDRDGDGASAPAGELLFGHRPDICSLPGYPELPGRLGAPP
jgi:hypothetical protein